MTPRPPTRRARHIHHEPKTFCDSLRWTLSRAGPSGADRRSFRASRMRVGRRSRPMSGVGFKRSPARPGPHGRHWFARGCGTVPDVLVGVPPREIAYRADQPRNGPQVNWGVGPHYWLSLGLRPSLLAERRYSRRSRPSNTTGLQVELIPHKDTLRDLDRNSGLDRRLGATRVTTRRERRRDRPDLRRSRRIP